ncbi:MAG: GDP-mannose 4,6-dehydratase [Kiritimatiellae bacterium]|nr:GDP-mannose 4,6-dehydratase [Kiritimatiellia bacterium]MDW8457897.1 GDP-mannose 4,6-dehydratase [Verrucomicrobiota bacterium]
MRILVTGARGFVGRHLMAELAAAGHEPVGLSRQADCPAADSSDRIADICDRRAVAEVVRDLQPEGCVHLAGVAFVPAGWTQPHHVFEVNVLGALNLLEALREHAPRCRTVLVSSALVYGAADPDRPRDEQAPLDPQSIYAVSKAASDLNGLLYARHYDLPVMVARPCNHIGPGQSAEFMAPSFARQLADIASGRQPAVIRVGNLDCVREFMDVRDVARAYRMLLERGRGGEAYNVSAGIAGPVRSILEELCRIAGVSPRIEIDPARWRPTDRQPLLMADKIRRETGWSPIFPLHQTLADIYHSMASAVGAS